MSDQPKVHPKRRRRKRKRRGAKPAPTALASIVPAPPKGLPPIAQRLAQFNALNKHRRAG